MSGRSAPANTLASFDAAHDVGVDVVEFDVRAWNGELMLAHTVLHARRGGNVRLQDALAYLSQRRFADLGLNVDLKHAGCEQAMVMDMDKFAKQALKDIPGTGGVQIDAGGGIFVQSQESGDEMTCPKVAKTFLSAPGHSVGPFTASVADMKGNEKCARDYDSDGKEIGAASRHMNTGNTGGGN